MDANKNAINGVYCEVQNCTYHTRDNKCVAGEIQVSPSRVSDNDPDCATFKQLDCCK